MVVGRRSEGIDCTGCALSNRGGSRHGVLITCAAVQASQGEVVVGCEQGLAEGIVSTTRHCRNSVPSDHTCEIRRQKWSSNSHKN